MTHFGPPPSATDTHRSGPHQQVFLGNFLVIAFPSLPGLGSLTFGIWGQSLIRHTLSSWEMLHCYCKVFLEHSLLISAGFTESATFLLITSGNVTLPGEAHRWMAPAQAHRLFSTYLGSCIKHPGLGLLRFLLCQSSIDPGPLYRWDWMC